MIEEVVVFEEDSEEVVEVFDDGARCGMGARKRLEEDQRLSE